MGSYKGKPVDEACNPSMNAQLTHPERYATGIGPALRRNAERPWYPIYIFSLLILEQSSDTGRPQGRYGSPASVHTVRCSRACTGGTTTGRGPRIRWSTRLAPLHHDRDCNGN